MKNILPSLESHFFDVINKQGAKPEDIVFILSQANNRRTLDAAEAKVFLTQKFPGVEIKFGDDFEGMEKAVVFTLTNGSLGDCPSIIPLSLTRANSHLVIFIEDFRNIFKEAHEKNLVVKKISQDIPAMESNVQMDQTATGLKEASAALTTLARKMTVQDIRNLAEEWGVQEVYNELEQQGATRFHLIEKMSEKYVETQQTTMVQFVESLRVANMSEAVVDKMATNLSSGVEELKGMVRSRFLTDSEQIGLAHSLGQRDLFDRLTVPTEVSAVAVPDQEALVTCLDTWRSQATELTNTEHLVKCLLMAGLSTIATEIKEEMDNTLAEIEIASYANIGFKEKIETTVVDVFLPILTGLFTVAYLAALASSKQGRNIWILVLIHWIPSACLFWIHLYLNHPYFGQMLSKFQMCLLLLFQPVSSTGLHISYLFRIIRLPTQAVERYKIKKLLHLAEATMMMNNFTSVLVASVILDKFNDGQITTKEPTLLVLATTIAVLHMVKLMINIIKKQARRQSLQQTFLMVIPVATSLTQKMVAILVLLSASTEYALLVAFIMCVLIIIVNGGLEKILIHDCHEDNGMKVAWMRTVHSLIFPLVLEHPGRRAILGLSLQLVVSGLGMAGLGFITAWGEGVREGMFLTHNMVMALGVTSVLMVLHSSLAFFSITMDALQNSSPPQEDFLEEDAEASEELNLRLLHQQQLNNPHGHQRTGRRRKAMLAMMLPSLVLLLSSPYPLLMYMFNTCPSLPSDPHSTITCTSSPATVDTQCTLSCSPMYWSASLLHSTCTWRGAWRGPQLSCRQQVVAIVGPAYDARRTDVPATQVYSPTGTKGLLPGLPGSGDDGSTGYVNGGLLYCGGEDASGTTVSTCQYLRPPERRWRATFPLLQVFLLSLY